MPLETVRRICAEREATATGFVPVEIAPEIRRREIALITRGGRRVEVITILWNG